jgi:hypothetical protein
MRTVFEKCASWKTPTISSKVRTLFQGAHEKVRIFAERCQKVVGSVQGAGVLGGSRFLTSVRCLTIFLVFLLVGVARGQESTESAGVKAVEARGGVLLRDEKSPDRPVIAVRFPDDLGVGVLQTGRFSDESLRILEAFPKLAAIDFQNTAVSGTHTRDNGLRLLKSFAALRSLGLRRTRIDDDGLSEIKDLQQLTSLDLSGSGISDRGMEQLDGLTNLERLDVSNTRVTGYSLKRLSRHAKLTDLRLNGLNILDDDFADLRSLKRLRHLALRSNPITNASAKVLSEFRDLASLDLSQTRISRRLRGFKN